MKLTKSIWLIAYQRIMQGKTWYSFLTFGPKDKDMLIEYYQEDCRYHKD